MSYRPLWIKGAKKGQHVHCFKRCANIPGQLALCSWSWLSSGKLREGPSRASEGVPCALSPSRSPQAASQIWRSLMSWNGSCRCESPLLLAPPETPSQHMPQVNCPTRQVDVLSCWHVSWHVLRHMYWRCSASLVTRTSSMHVGWVRGTELMKRWCK